MKGRNWLLVLEELESVASRSWVGKPSFKMQQIDPIDLAGMEMRAWLIQLFIIKKWIVGEESNNLFDLAYRYGWEYGWEEAEPSCPYGLTYGAVVRQDN